jgi:Tfp pilus assembly protein PilF
MDYDWDWAAAETNFQKALQLDPNYATAYHWYAALFQSRGQLQDSRQMYARALKHDPLSLLIRSEMSMLLLQMGMFDEAEEQLFQVLEADRNFSIAHLNLGQIYSTQGKYEKAIREYQKAVDIPWDAALLGFIYAKIGEYQKAREILAELSERSKTKYVRPTAIAVIYFGLGDVDEAFHWIEKGIEERDPVMPWIRFVVPKEGDLHSHPRYKTLMKKLDMDI